MRIIRKFYLCRKGVGKKRTEPVGILVTEEVHTERGKATKINTVVKKP